MAQAYRVSGSPWPSIDDRWLHRIREPASTDGRGNGTRSSSRSIANSKSSHPNQSHIMSKSVFCIATTPGRAESLVQRLQAQGFAASEISVLLPGSSGTNAFSDVKSTKASEGLAAGATAGGVAGGALGLLAGFGVLAIPGIGPFVAGGPFIAALSGAALGATTGGIVGGLIGLGIPEIEARRYEEKLKKGHCLISAHADNSDQIERAKAIFSEAGAEDINTVSESSATAA